MDANENGLCKVNKKMRSAKMPSSDQHLSKLHIVKEAEHALSNCKKIKKLEQW